MQPYRVTMDICNGINHTESNMAYVNAPVSPPCTPPAGNLTPPVPALLELNQSSKDNGQGPKSSSTDEAVSKRPCKRNAKDAFDQGTSESRRYRTAFSKEQLDILEREFSGENYISKIRRCEIARELALSESTIKVWFQNRRMKDKRHRSTLLDSKLAAYIQAAAAASGYPNFLSTPVSPWTPTSFLGMGPLPPVPYLTHVDFNGAHHSPASRYAPYPRPHGPMSPPYSSIHNEVTSISPLSSPMIPAQPHLPSCPAYNSPKELCLCGLIYPAAFTGTHPYPNAALPSYSPTLSSTLHRNSSPVSAVPTLPVPLCIAKSQSTETLSKSPNASSKSSTPKLSVSTPKLFKPYDDEPVTQK